MGQTKRVLHIISHICDSVLDLWENKSEELDPPKRSEAASTDCNESNYAPNSTLSIWKIIDFISQLFKVQKVLSLWW